MTYKLAAQLSALNQHQITRYLDAQGLQPAAIRRGETEYKLLIGEEVVTIVVGHCENRFLDEDHRRQGSLSDLVCLLYTCRYSDLCADPTLYGFDKLLPKTY